MDSPRAMQEFVILSRICLYIEANEYTRLTKVLEKVKKIYLAHFELIDYKLYELYNDESRRYRKCKIAEDQSIVLEIQLRYYKNLISYPKDFFDYTALVCCLRKCDNLFENLEKDKQIHWLPSNFFDKFVNIRRIYVKDLDDESDFLIFLRKCNFLLRN